MVLGGDQKEAMGRVVVASAANPAASEPRQKLATNSSSIKRPRGGPDGDTDNRIFLQVLPLGRTPCLTAV